MNAEKISVIKALKDKPVGVQTTIVCSNQDYRKIVELLEADGLVYERLSRTLLTITKPKGWHEKRNN